MNVSAIITSDMHIRKDKPECRLDNYFITQAAKISFLKKLQEKYRCPILDAGDLFNTWHPGEYLCQWSITNLPDGIITIPGNHDLPSHNIALYENSGLAVLEAAKKVTVLKSSTDPIQIDNGVSITGFPYGETFAPAVKGTDRIHVALVHTYVGESIPPNVKGYTPKQLLQALPGFDLIISGHNHVPLVYIDPKSQRVIINPGSMMRMFADQGDMKPRCYLWDSDANEIKTMYFPIEAGVVSREHIEQKQAREDRISAFVDQLNNAQGEISLSFEQNMEEHIAANAATISKDIQDLIWEAIDGG